MWIAISSNISEHTVWRPISVSVPTCAAKASNAQLVKPGAPLIPLYQFRIHMGCCKAKLNVSLTKLYAFVEWNWSVMANAFSSAQYAFPLLFVPFNIRCISSLGTPLKVACITSAQFVDIMFLSCKESITVCRCSTCFLCRTTFCRCTLCLRFVSISRSVVSSSFLFSFLGDSLTL